jgi:hypothetical protein
MTNDQVSRSIQELEGWLGHDDPKFLKRFRALRRAEVATVLSVFLLIAGGAVLLTLGLATRSWPAWCGGMISLLTSIVVDEHHKHALRRTR